MKKECNLSTCNNIFYLDTKSKNTNQKYCCKKCGIESRRLRQDPVECIRDGCSNTFRSLDKKKRFCSHACAAIVNNSSKVTHGMYSRKIEKFCIVCIEPINRMSKKFCSHDCYNEFKNNETIIRWKLGDTSVVTHSNGRLSNSAKKILAKFSGNKCTECGWNTPNPVLGRPILAVDHIDGDRYNNMFENLKVLCYNCHTLTETFGTLNGMSKYDIIE